MIYLLFSCILLSSYSCIMSMENPSGEGAGRNWDLGRYSAFGRNSAAPQAVPQFGRSSAHSRVTDQPAQPNTTSSGSGWDQGTVSDPSFPAPAPRLIITSELLDNINIEQRLRQLFKKLITSIEQDDENIPALLEQYIKHGGSLDRCLDGYMLLHKAIRKNHLGITALLLTNKVDINAFDDEGYQPLHLAVMQGDRNMVKFLLDNGADVKAYDRKHGHRFDWEEPQYTGSRNFDLVVRIGALQQSIEWLLTNKTNSKAVEGKGYQPLHIAIMRGDVAMVRLLINNGADIHAQDRPLGRTPLTLALIQNDEAMVDYFLKIFMKESSESRQIEMDANPYIGPSPTQHISEPMSTKLIMGWHGQ